MKPILVAVTAVTALLIAAVIAIELVGQPQLLNWPSTRTLSNQQPEPNETENTLPLQPANSQQSVIHDPLHGFALRYPPLLQERTLQNRPALVDDADKAGIALILCPPTNPCTPMPPESTSLFRNQDYEVTSDTSSLVPEGETRFVHVIEAHDLPTSKGERVLEQHYEITAFDSTGSQIDFPCGPDTMCRIGGPYVRFLFFSPAKPPYVVWLRSLYPFDQVLPIAREVVSTVSY